jgi:hypothetical protein
MSESNYHPIKVSESIKKDFPGIATFAYATNELLYILYGEEEEKAYDTFRIMFGCKTDRFEKMVFPA